MDGFKRILERGGEIIANAPPFASEKDKVKMLSLHFRLDKIDCRNILKKLRNIE